MFETLLSKVPANTLTKSPLKIILTKKIVSVAGENPQLTEGRKTFNELITENRWQSYLGKNFLDLVDLRQACEILNSRKKLGLKKDNPLYREAVERVTQESLDAISKLQKNHEKRENISEKEKIEKALAFLVIKTKGIEDYRILQNDQKELESFKNKKLNSDINRELKNSWESLIINIDDIAEAIK